MRNLIIFFLFTLVSCTSKGQLLGINVSGGSTPPPSTTPLLLIFAGESNSGGLAGNSYATSPELAKRKLKILNNSTLASFDSLDIGSNNLTGHNALEYAAADAHGWELELANKVDSGYFGSREVFLCKAGQGGTKIVNWFAGSFYNGSVYSYETFLLRVDSARTIIERETGEEPDIVILWSQGINDAADTTGWKNNQIKVFENIKEDLGFDVPIVVTQFQSISIPAYFNTSISEIAALMTNIYPANTSGAETSQVFAGAGGHWGYTGAKLVADIMLAIVLNDIL